MPEHSSSPESVEELQQDARMVQIQSVQMKYRQLVLERSLEKYINHYLRALLKFLPIITGKREYRVEWAAPQQVLVSQLYVI